VAREIALRQGTAGRQINISVWGWETLEQRISEHADAMNAFDPTFGPHAAYLIHAAAGCPEVADPISTIPEPLRSLADVELAHVDLLRIRGQVPEWWKEAKGAHLRHPDHKFLNQYAAEAELDELGRSSELRQGRISVILKQ
jgi:hypothetical protein